MKAVVNGYQSECLKRKLSFFKVYVLWKYLPRIGVRNSDSSKKVGFTTLDLTLIKLCGNKKGNNILGSKSTLEISPGKKFLL